jgi:hypothetical protein
MTTSSCHGSGVKRFVVGNLAKARHKHHANMIRTGSEPNSLQCPANFSLRQKAGQSHWGTLCTN